MRDPTHRTESIQETESSSADHHATSHHVLRIDRQYRQRHLPPPSPHIARSALRELHSCARTRPVFPHAGSQSSPRSYWRALAPSSSFSLPLPWPVHQSFEHVVCGLCHVEVIRVLRGVCETLLSSLVRVSRVVSQTMARGTLVFPFAKHTRHTAVRLFIAYVAAGGVLITVADPRHASCARPGSEGRKTLLAIDSPSDRPHEAL